MTAQTLLAAAASVGCEAGLCPFSAIADRLLPCRATARLPQNAATVLVMLFPYRIQVDPPKNLSRYAAVNDYHRAAGEVLEQVAAQLRAADPNGDYQAFIDNSPLPEVQTAVAAGLGVRGDNGLLLHPRFGSYVFIGCIVTDRDLQVTASPLQTCDHCGACRRACPTDRLTSGGDCLSAITQRKGELTEREIGMMRAVGTAWGCDRCQEVCPYNRDAVISPHPCFTAYENEMTEASLDNLDGKAYGWRGKSVPQRNLCLLKNSDEKLLPIDK